MRQFMALLERRNSHREGQQWQLASMMALVANCHRGKGKVFQPKDFMPHEEKGQSPEDMLKVVKMLNASLGAKP